MKRTLSGCCWLALIAMFSTPVGALAWQDDDEDIRPGLVARVTTEGKSQEAIVTDPIVAPLREGAASKHVWQGSFLIRSDGPHQFHAYLSGEVTVRLGEEVVLQARSDRPAWVSGPQVELSFGERPLEITAELRSVGDQCKLYWSSEAFPLEPLPYHALFHEADTTSLRLAEQGHDYVEAWRCLSCHTETRREEALPGPSLKTFGAGTAAGWLRERLTRKEPAPHGRMPAFGFSQADADAILAYLDKQAQPPQLSESKLKRTANDVAAGAQLVKSVGCLACHTWNELGKNPLLGGGPLDGIGKQRSPDWLLAKITDPHGVNASSRMPTFALSDAERKQIVLALIDEKPPRLATVKDSIKSTDQLVERGRSLIREARCAACHELPGDVPPLEVLQPLTAERVSGPTSCVGGSPDPARRRPHFAIDPAKAIAAYFATTPAGAETASADAVGARLLQTKGCLNCHDRNGSRGLSAITKDIVRTEPTWEGQTPTLSPPSLGAVGDRLPDAALLKGVRGELPRRMDWLKVRMPKFRHTAEEAQALAEHLIAWDRIPDEAPASPVYPVSPGAVDPEVMLAGRELTGGKGFSCVACHQLKDYVPPKVALGTRGSDLYRLGDRMRESYFFRWTRSPLRVLPGIEMPSYQRPHPTFLGGDLHRQLAAIWDALHDPQFTAPSNPAVVEQLWGPSEDGRPRVLRDVLTLTAGDGKLTTVPRSFAVGFANRHSVLFDLEHGCVRAWTIGDFTQQRTQGKSWFWDLAGVPVAKDFPLRSDVYLVHNASQTPLTVDTGYRASVRLLTYAVRHQFAMELTYEISWQIPGSSAEPVTAIIQEIWQPLNAEGIGQFGWVRELTLRHVPRGHSVWVQQPEPQHWLADAKCSVRIDHGWRRPAENAPLAVPFESNGADGFWPTTLVYSTSIRSPEATLAPPLPLELKTEPVTCIPGFQGERLPLPRSIMPTALTWTPQNELVFTSLKGHVYQVDPAAGARDRPLKLIAEGLSAPFGVIAVDRDLLVAHKPEVIRIRRVNDAPLFRQHEVVATGWGFTDDYHDWTCGIVRDFSGDFYIGLGSDYSHKNRPQTESRWRGHILRFDLTGKLEPIATGLRYPTGLAMLPGDRLVTSDQQGVQNCFNEINFIQVGHRYGVPAQLDPRDDAPADVAAVQIPHPWTRSVNGLAVWPDNGHPFAGQIIGAEYNGRFLIRASVELVDGVLQGAVYQLHRPGETNGPTELLGPMCVGFSPAGNLYVGSIHDSGWLGGLNTGDIVRFTPNDALPNGIQRVRATAEGFAIDFPRALDRQRALDPTQYKFSGYTRVWQGTYATEDSGRHAPTVTGVTLSEDGRTVNLALEGLKTGHVYDITIGDIGAGEPLWPTVAHYTLHRRPR